MSDIRISFEGSDAQALLASGADGAIETNREVPVTIGTASFRCLIQSWRRTQGTENNPFENRIAVDLVVVGKL